MRKYIFCFFAISATANIPPLDVSDNHQIAVQNSILAKVNGKALSVMDVKKKMDLAFYKNYGHLAQSNQARHQFYEGSWRFVLKELVDQELLLTKAEELQIPLSDGDIRSEIESRFGPNIMITLDKIGLSYDEAFQMIKDEMIVQRMNWWFIQSKAVSSVSPQDIRNAFQKYTSEHPSFQEIQYHVISMRGNDSVSAGKKAHSLLIEKSLSPQEALPELKKIDPTTQVSSLYTATDQELSITHKAALTGLSPGSYSEPFYQKSRNGELVGRIFFLKESTSHPAPQFESVAYELKNTLIQKAVAQESASYLAKLRKDYPIYENLPEDLHPFILK